VSANPAISIEQLTDRPLPIFGHSAQAFRQLQAEPNAPWGRYGDIILKDPGLALCTLQELHAASSKRSAEIAGMEQAAMLLGLERVQKLPHGAPQMERSLTGVAKAGFARAATRAFHAAFQVWDWAHIIKEHAPEEMLLAALLHDVAEMALWVAAPEQMHLFRKLMLKDGIATDEAQYLAFGESLEHFSRGIATRWHLPQLVHEALRPENAGNRRVQGVMLAVQLARAAERGWYWEKINRLLPQIAEYLGAGEADTATHLHNNAVRAAREAAFYGARPAAALLPLLPGGDHVLIQDEFPDEAKPGEKTAPASNSTEEAAHTTVCLLPQPVVFTQMVEELEASLGKLSMNDIMRRVLHGMHDGAGLNRVVFAMLTPDGKKLQARYMIGSDNDPAFNRFEIVLDKPHLFTRLMEKPQSLWINDGNRQKFWPLVPDIIKLLIKTDTFCAMSFHVRGKPIGLFYADRHSAECHLDEHTYQRFRQLSQLAAKGLTLAAEKGPGRGETNL
jgi:HD-like signal output (HDOD) protein